jgi:spermidine synthase
MRPGLEVLAYRQTRMGVLTLFRRTELTLGRDVFEVKLGDEYLMSSLFTHAEEELARLGLAACVGEELDVVVGGLGLGFTARAALEDERVASLVIVEAFPEVIGWHADGLIAPTRGIAEDARTTFVAGDFFALALGADGFDAAGANHLAHAGRRFDAILLDVDHTPTHVLDGSHAALYTVEGLTALGRWLRPDGVFALWADSGPDEHFVAVMSEVFDDVVAQVVTFPNALTGQGSANIVYLGRLPGRE